VSPHLAEFKTLSCRTGLPISGKTYKKTLSDISSELPHGSLSVSTIAHV